MSNNPFYWLHYTKTLNAIQQEKQDNSMPRGKLNTVKMYVVIHVLLPIVHVCG